MPNIFICYRRDDSGANARELHARLNRQFGGDRIFYDIRTIRRGDDFAARIRREVEASEIMLVLIGRQWAGMCDAQGRRRLDQADDLVRREVETGFACGLRMIPVLVNGASMPPRHDLPVSLRRLCDLDPHEISHARAEFDADQLVAALGGTPAAATPEVDFWDKLAGSFAATFGERLGERLAHAAAGPPAAPALPMARPQPARDLSGDWHAVRANARHRITQRGQQIYDELLNPFGMVVGRAQGALLGDQIHLTYEALTPMGPVRGEVHATVSGDGSVIRGMAFDPMQGRHPVEMRRL